MKQKKNKATAVRSRPEPSTPEVDKAEQAEFIETLKANRQLAPEGKPLPPGATHQIVTDAQGRKRVVRRRFSAIQAALPHVTQDLESSRKRTK